MSVQSALSILFTLLPCLVSGAITAQNDTSSTTPKEMHASRSTLATEHRTRFDHRGLPLQYQNGFFVNVEDERCIRVWDKDGNLVSDFTTRPQGWPRFDDVIVLRDGSIVASIISMAGHDNRRLFDLIHYEPSRKIIEQLDLGEWRSPKICVDDDLSVWGVSRKEPYGVDVSLPEEAAFRQYKFGSGFQRAIFPRSQFPSADYLTHLNRSTNAFACTENSVLGVLASGERIDATTDGIFHIQTIDKLSDAVLGRSWEISSLIYIDSDHVYGVIHPQSDPSTGGTLARLILTDDHSELKWVGVLPKEVASITTDRPVLVSNVLGIDRKEEQVVYQTSADDSIFWAKLKP